MATIKDLCRNWEKNGPQDIETTLKYLLTMWGYLTTFETTFPRVMKYLGTTKQGDAGNRGPGQQKELND